MSRAQEDYMQAGKIKTTSYGKENGSHARETKKKDKDNRKMSDKVRKAR